MEGAWVVHWQDRGRLVGTWAAVVLMARTLAAEDKLAVENNQVVEGRLAEAVEGRQPAVELGKELVAVGDKRVEEGRAVVLMELFRELAMIKRGSKQFPEEPHLVHQREAQCHVVRH